LYFFNNTRSTPEVADATNNQVFVEAQDQHYCADRFLVPVGCPGKTGSNCFVKFTKICDFSDFRMSVVRCCICLLYKALESFKSFGRKHKNSQHQVKVTKLLLRETDETDTLF